MSDLRCGFVTDTSGYFNPAIAELRISTSSASVSGYLLFDLDSHPALSACAWSDAEVAGQRTSPELTLRNAVANVLCGPLLRCLDTVGLKDVQVTSIKRGASPPPPPNSTTFWLSLTMHEQQYDAIVQLPCRGMEWLDACLSRTARLRYLDASLRVPGSIVLGTKRLSVDTLQNLRSGDILLRSLDTRLDVTWLHYSDSGSDTACQPIAFATWGDISLTHYCAAVAIQAKTITLLKEPVMTEPPVSSIMEAGVDAPSAERAVEVGELEIPVQFVAETVALTINEMSSLAPGYVIELPTAIADLTLSLVAHGQVIGHGEIVAVGEHVGIRILRMAHDHDSVH